MQVQENKVVSISYRLTNDQGELLDSTDGQAPLPYLHGAGSIIVGLERALEGKSAGDSFEITLEPEDAYGEYDEELVHHVDREQLAGLDAIELGQIVEAESEDGIALLTIVEIDDEDGSVTLDGNHELAGETLHFAVTVVEIRDATPEEIEHGHVHGPDGHHHDHE